MEFDNFNKVEENMYFEKPKSYLGLSILSTILGFCSCIGFVTGIVAIVMSVTSSSKYKNGDYEESVRYAKYAKIISLVTIGIFVLSLVYSWYSIQQMGGWDAYLQMINDAVKQGEAY